MKYQLGSVLEVRTEETEATQIGKVVGFSFNGQGARYEVQCGDETFNVAEEAVIQKYVTARVRKLKAVQEAGEAAELEEQE